MQPEVLVIAIAAIGATTVISVLKMWLNRPARAAVPQADLREIRDGLARLEQAVDAIALEVERVSEGQRFTTKLLAERASDVVPIPPPTRQR
jgi:hypothetical protein